MAETLALKPLEGPNGIVVLGDVEGMQTHKQFSMGNNPSHSEVESTSNLTTDWSLHYWQENGLWFIFSNHFIMVRVAADPESILGITGMKQEHTLDEAPVHHKASYTHFYSHSRTHSHLEAI